MSRTLMCWLMPLDLAYQAILLIFSPGEVHCHDQCARFWRQPDFCRAVLPNMIKRNRGSIINVSSMVAFSPLVGNTVYAATKSYLNMFSRSLQTELGNFHIRVQALCPGFTYTGFHDTEEYRDFSRSSVPKALWMSAQEVAERSLKALSKNKVVFVPGIKNRILAGLMNNETISRCIIKFKRQR